MTRRVLLLFPWVAFGQAPSLVSVQKIWDQGPHNAFTDLLRFHNEWFCAFRE